MWMKKLIGGTANLAQAILYSPTGRAQTNVKAELDRINSDLTELRPKLLWTNSSPSSAFAAQTIPLDLSTYRFVEIYCSPTASVMAASTKLRVGGGQGQLTFISGSTSTAVGTVGNFRNCYATTTGVVFSDNGQASTGAAVSAQNQNNVPFEIWGIK